MIPGKILIIDDDPGFLDAYDEKLGREGYVVEMASSGRAGLEKLEQPGWDVVLLDQKLQGPTGPDSGLSLIPEIVMRAPRARIILVTGFGTAKAIALAFDAGVHDYLQKDELFSALLVPKLRRAVEAARALRMVGMTSDETEAAIRTTWEAAQHEADANRKGKLLEDLMVLLIKTIPGWHHATPRRQNDIEEIDILIRNESSDPLWIKEGQYVLVECKNWSKPVGASELTVFLAKMKNRNARCNLGLFVAPGGFTGPFKDNLLAGRHDSSFVLLLGHETLEGFITSSDRNAYLKKLHTDALVDQNGH
jgi:DNA-binding NarL/FixJ family response regulator